MINPTLTVDVFVNAILLPAHPLAIVNVAVGSGFTVTVRVVELVQPFDVVVVKPTVYVPLVEYV